MYEVAERHFLNLFFPSAPHGGLFPAEVKVGSGKGTTGWELRDWAHVNKGDWTNEMLVTLQGTFFVVTVCLPLYSSAHTVLELNCFNHLWPPPHASYHASLISSHPVMTGPPEWTRLDKIPMPLVKIYQRIKGIHVRFFWSRCTSTEVCHDSLWEVLNSIQNVLYLTLNSNFSTTKSQAMDIS